MELKAHKEGEQKSLVLTFWDVEKTNLDRKIQQFPKLTAKNGADYHMLGEQ